MFLKSLELKGFKSFADTTRLDFESGVTVVVGPNGSGKSNVVDGISWVMGSQAPSSVRSGKMEDVIFAGSNQRKALGRAEVSLIIDNEEGRGSLDFSEIAITRTLFRSGESQYSINGAPCRLLDVAELLSDGGMGQSQHMIVSQGQVDAVLNDRAEDRRMIIEEAAGILKHRKRKEKAENRLKGTDADLARLGDLTREVSRQLEPLQRQAEAARQHGELLANLTELRIYAAGRELNQLKIEKDSLEAGQQGFIESQSRLNSQSQELEAEITEAEDLMGRFGADVSGETLASLERLKARVQNAIENLKSKALNLDAANIKKRELESIREQQNTVRQALEIQREAASDLEAESERLSAKFEEIQETQTKFAEQKGYLSVLGYSSGSNQEVVDESQKELLALENKSIEITGLIDKAQHQKAEVEAEKIHWISRIEAVALAQGFSGKPKTPDGVKILGDLLRVEPGYEKAVIAGLGEALDAILAPNRESAVQFLRDFAERGSSATVLYVENSDSRGDLSQEAKYLSSKVSSTEPGVNSLLERLLDGIYVVENLEQALDLHLETGRVAVALSGERFAPQGWRLAADSSLSSSDLAESLRKSAEAEAKANLAELEVKAGALSRNLEELTSQAQEIQVRKKALDNQIQVESGKATDTEIKKVEINAQMRELAGRLETQTQRHKKDTQTQAARKKEQEQKIQNLEVELASLKERRSLLEQALDSALDSGGASFTRAEHKLLAIAQISKWLANTQTRVEESLADLRESRKQEFQKSNEAKAKLGSLRNQREEVLAELAGSKEALTKSEVAIAEVSVRLENAVLNLDRDLNISPAEAINAPCPNGFEETAAEEKIKEIEHELRLIGPVNPLALREYEGIKERHTFLTSQIQDVKLARKDLRKLIRAVEIELVNSFEAAYSDIAANFKDLFELAFPGGEGQLKLTNPDDFQSTGVAIEARPGDKTIKKLSLLSGGERSLVALTFLIAVLKSRPAPFCIMDEVDAALDDINLSRFLELVKELRGETQLLIVTHQKHTMEAADCLYGISMSAEGVTKVISERAVKSRKSA